MDNLQVSYTKYNQEEKSSEENSSYFDKEVNGFQFATIKKTKPDPSQTHKKRPVNIPSTLNSYSKASPTKSYSSSQKPEILVATTSNVQKDTGWDPVSSVDIPMKNSKKNECFKQETFGWVAENSIALDPIGNILIGQSKSPELKNSKNFEKSDTLGWRPDESVAVDGFGVDTRNLKKSIKSPDLKNSKNFEKSDTLGWRPDESVAVDGFGVDTRNLPLKKKSIIKDSKVFEKKETSGWKPEESLCVNGFGSIEKNATYEQKLIKEEPTGWLPDESVVISGPAAPKYKSNVSIVSPIFPALENVKEEEKAENGFTEMDSVQIPNKKEKREEKKNMSGWDEMQSIDVNEGMDVIDSVPLAKDKNKTLNSNYTL